jgi:hypothetical protein
MSHARMAKIEDDTFRLQSKPVTIEPDRSLQQVRNF